jgi:hypothetical protein
MELNNNNMEVSHLFPQPLARFRAPNDVIQAAMSVIDISIGGDQRALWQYITDCANDYCIDVLGLSDVVVRDMEKITIDTDTTFLSGDHIAFGVFAVHIPHNICRIQYSNPSDIMLSVDTVHCYSKSDLFISKNELLIFTSAPKIIPPKNEEDSIFITFKIKYYVD